MNEITKNIEQLEILNKIKNAVLELEPEAEVYLFGSRARGDYNEDSDWDLLILLPGKIDYERKKKIFDKLYDIQLILNQVFNTFINSNQNWNSNEILKQSFFYDNVKTESILI